MPVMSKCSGATMAGAAALIGGAAFVGLPSGSSSSASRPTEVSLRGVAQSSSSAAPQSSSCCSSLGGLGVAGLAALALSSGR
ncbi:unnamed protein product, partial [Polarella glacialis]